MDNKAKYIDAQKFDYKIQNKKRGEILYYSIDQVADLLNEDIGNIKYYTNIFDDILKIEIVHKELRYTNNDVDKLELLIKLKNRGMTLKEIEDYYSKLPLDDTEVRYSESNLISVEDLVDSIKREQQIQLDNFKTEFIKDIQNTNSLILQNITSSIIDAQTKSLNEFKQNLQTEIEEYLDSKFEKFSEVNRELQNNLLTNISDVISEKIHLKNNELKLHLQSNFDKFSKSSLDGNESLIKEVKDFKRVMQDAYYTQYEIEMTENNETGFLGKLLQSIKAK
ncbi:MerR family transcriptional regulator [Clostridium sp. YIM B02505]|uniref:MerR family transcriptional regulator n=1 Tax=Clostridium yunnanense TaxID=2800325 RepID=A0ABS1ETJ9_9CLOT|nr:helix-turn-helix domain-containing protein [Clostridium yunnanense]MBK1812704.1 MerR family transcriptional regulator [Clostridium yunnanense]